MFKDITYEKVEEIVALAEEAEQPPDKDEQASDRYPVTHTPPLRPQPAPTWKQALPRYLADLSPRAVAELEALYRLGTGGFDSLDEALSHVGDQDVTQAERVDFLLSRSDLVLGLRTALEAR